MRTLLLLLILIPSALLGLTGCLHEDERDDPRNAFAPHYATAWRTTPAGLMRDAGPFGSVAAGYTTDDEIDAAVDAAHADFVARFPEFSWVRPWVHLTDDYVFFANVPGGGFASGWHLGDGEVVLALWSRGTSATDPGDVWIKRAPGDSFGAYMDHWRYTARRLVPAYQHECLHVAIGDPTHASPLWARVGKGEGEGAGSVPLGRCIGGAP